MIKKLKPSERFINLLLDGKFKEPEFIKCQKLGVERKCSKTQMNRDLKNYIYFMNSSHYDDFAKVKVRRYNGDNFY